MNLPATPAAEPIPIAYDSFGSSEMHLRLRGKGELRIDPVTGDLAFSGKPRRSLTGPRVEELIYADQVADVVVVGKRVTFNCMLNPEGSKAQPVLFYCRDPATALRLAQALPDRRSLVGDQDATKVERLQAVCPPLAPLTSPTNGIIATCALVFILMGFAGAGWLETASMEPYVKYGANYGPYTTGGEWHRLFTSVFLHYGIIHVALNMWVLSSAGHLLERLLGRTLFLINYVGAGAIGSLASIYWHQSDPVWSAGASGAVFGVFGSVLAFALRAKSSLPPSLFSSLRNGVITFIVYNIVFGSIHPGIDNAAHLGGLVGGFLLGLASSVSIDRSDRSSVVHKRIPVTIGVLAILVAGGIAGAPRFDYTGPEITAYDTVVGELAESEHALLNLHYPSVAAIGNDVKADLDKARSALEQHIIPFYRQWADRLSSLAFAKESLFSRNRDRLMQYADLNARGYALTLEELERNPNNPNFAAANALLEQASALAEEIEQP